MLKSHHFALLLHKLSSFLLIFIVKEVIVILPVTTYLNLVALVLRVYEISWERFGDIKCQVTLHRPCTSQLTGSGQVLKAS